MNITTLFEVGQPIYFLSETAIKFGVIECIELEVYPRERCEGTELLITYKLSNSRVSECRAFDSKESIIKHLEQSIPESEKASDQPF